MTKYKMSDGMVVDTDNATAQWAEATRWDGQNHVSVPTASQWNHQALYRSRRGRYYVVRWSQWQGSVPAAEWVSNEEAARWLVLNAHALPADLRHMDVTE
jgi:hypothetical protein